MPAHGIPERGSVEDGILTCLWHHARFDVESGCRFDLWADDVPICPVKVRNGEVWVKTTFGQTDPAAHWHQRLANGLTHDIELVITKAVHGLLTADVPRVDIVRQVAPFGAQNRDGWGVRWPMCGHRCIVSRPRACPLRFAAPAQSDRDRGDVVADAAFGRSPRSGEPVA